MTQGFRMIDAPLFAILLLLIGLSFVIGIDPCVHRKHRHTMLIIVAQSLSLIAQNLGDNALFVHHSDLAVKNVPAA